MKTHNLKLFNTGQVTLPKSRREQFATHLFLAEETEQGLLIKPLLSDQKEVDNTLSDFIENLRKQALENGLNQSEINTIIENAKSQLEK